MTHDTYETTNGEGPKNICLRLVVVPVVVANLFFLISFLRFFAKGGKEEERFFIPLKDLVSGGKFCF